MEHTTKCTGRVIKAGGYPPIITIELAASKEFIINLMCEGDKVELYRDVDIEITISKQPQP